MSYVSSFARASQNSNLVGIHSTALYSKTLASYSFDNSINSFHKSSELGIYSRALFKTLHFMILSFSLLTAANHILTLFGITLIALAKIYLDFSSVSNLALSIQISSASSTVYKA